MAKRLFFEPYIYEIPGLIRLRERHASAIVALTATIHSGDGGSRACSIIVLVFMSLLRVGFR